MNVRMQPFQRPSFNTKLPATLSSLDDTLFEYCTISELETDTVLDLMQTADCDDASLFFILMILFDNIQQGSICLTLQPFAGSVLQEKLNRLDQAGLLPVPPQELITGFTSSLECYSTILGTSSTDFKPIIYLQHEKVTRLYFQRYAIHVAHLQQQIQKRLHPGQGSAMIDIFKEMQDIKQTIFKAGESLNPEQIEAVKTSLTHSLAIISGGPGTGKTRISSTIVTLLLKAGVCPGRISLCAPTGRAARKLLDQVNQGIDNAFTKSDNKPVQFINSGTLHKILGFSGRNNRFRHSSSNPLPADWVLVDEVSMIDAVMMSRLFDACRPDTVIILLGDRDQLPSVQAGAILHDLIPDRGVAMETVSALQQQLQKQTILLTRCYRTQGNSYLLSQTIKDLGNIPGDDQIETVLSRLSNVSIEYHSHTDNPEKSPAMTTGWFLNIENSEDNCFLIESDDRHPKEHLFAFCRKWMNCNFGSDHYLSSIESISTMLRNPDDRDSQAIQLLFENFVNRSRILSITNSGRYGSNNVNAICMSILAGYGNDNICVPARMDRLIPGTPVMVTINNYALNLFNGDTGVVISGQDFLPLVLFWNGSQAVTHPLTSLPGLVPAFAITVHKSQGSEYDHVAVILPDNINSPLLTREIIYTALTRSRSTSTVYGKRDILKESIKRRIIREGGIILS